MKGGWHRGRRLLRAWAAAIGLFVLVHVLMLAAYALLEYLRLVSVASALALAAIFVLALVPTMVAAYRIIGRADMPVEDREAHAAGRPATAEVVRVERTRWRLDGNLNFKLQVTRRRWEYRIFVRVALPGEPPYEAEIAEFLLSEQVPKQGDVLNVKVHARIGDVVVWTR